MTDRRAEGALLLAATFVIAVSGLAYELIAGAAASYLLGDSVTQFSLVVGIFMTAMGLGAWASRYVEDPTRAFCTAQIALGLIGGFSAPLFFLAWLHAEPFEVVLFGIVIVTGALSGLEIPLIVRILEKLGLTRHAVSNVLTLDYAGALVAALIFPLVVVPRLGLLSGSLVFGMLNLGVALIAIRVLKPTGMRPLALACMGALAVTGLGLVGGERAVSAAEAALYDDDVVHAEASPYQRIVVTNFRGRTRLFLDGSIQFDSRDEHRYHEALVHPAMTRALRTADVLILGGGDGMAAREVLRYPVQSLTLVDLDPAVTRLFRDTDLARLSGSALRDPRVTIVNRDAWVWAKGTEQRFDVIIVDLPDPRTLALSKLYTRGFYTDLSDLLSAGGVMAVQSGAPFFARKAYWSVVETLEATRNPHRPGARLDVVPYAVWVPSFGLWGFALAGPELPAAPRRPPPPGLKMFAPDQWAAMRHFPEDTARLPVEANTLRSHVLARYYEEGWAAWGQ
ncbi:MAG: polyamine aminopropyltransferase [Pseudomonadota bacterium]